MKKILLIEDNTEVRENLTEILQMANYNAFSARDGKEDIKLIKKETPDLIICDIMMPVMDGYGVLHIISKDPKYSSIPFIFLSAKNDHADVRKGMDLGADDFLRKPVEGEDLLKTVEIRLRKSELLQAHATGMVKDSRDIMPAERGLKMSDLLSAELEVKQYTKGQVVYQAGNRANNLFYVVSGKLKTYKQTEQGSELIISILREGDFFGYSALLDSSAYTDNTEALEATTLKLIPKEKFLAIMFGPNETANDFIRLLTKNISEKEERLIRLAYNSLRKRVADGILYLQEKFKTSNDGNGMFKISRQNLANVTGASKESVIRMLSDFKNEKLIGIEDGSIIVLREDKLRKMNN